MLYMRRGALTSSSVNSPFCVHNGCAACAPRDQHAAVNYASKPRLELEPAELNVWPFATDRIRTIGVNEPHLFHRPSSRWRALPEVSSSFLPSCSVALI